MSLPRQCSLPPSRPSSSPHPNVDPPSLPQLPHDPTSSAAAPAAAAASGAWGSCGCDASASGPGDSSNRVARPTPPPSSPSAPPETVATGHLRRPAPAPPRAPPPAMRASGEPNDRSDHRERPPYDSARRAGEGAAPPNGDAALPVPTGGCGDAPPSPTLATSPSGLRGLCGLCGLRGLCAASVRGCLAPTSSEGPITGTADWREGRRRRVGSASGCVPASISSPPPPRCDNGDMRPHGPPPAPPPDPDPDPDPGPWPSPPSLSKAARSAALRPRASAREPVCSPARASAAARISRDGTPSQQVSSRGGGDAAATRSPPAARLCGAEGER
mmetsp:Transcript_20633/g.66214  ORF Transcript_20633/g.66214 Transcript_20633/m.66214 type:complete len:330 (-) Transcript_20633:33-1022(-)